MGKKHTQNRQSLGALLIVQLPTNYIDKGLILSPWRKLQPIGQKFIETHYSPDTRMPLIVPDGCTHLCLLGKVRSLTHSTNRVIRSTLFYDVQKSRQGKQAVLAGFQLSS